jgi:hypothetical protein
VLRARDVGLERGRVCEQPSDPLYEHGALIIHARLKLQLPFTGLNAKVALPQRLLTVKSLEQLTAGPCQDRVPAYTPCTTATSLQNVVSET